MAPYVHKRMAGISRILVAFLLVATECLFQKNLVEGIEVCSRETRMDMEIIPSMDDIFDAGYAIKLPTTTGCFYLYRRECLKIKHHAVASAKKITTKRNAPPHVDVAKIDDLRKLHKAEQVI